jgi:flagellar motor component MotA
MYRFALGKAFFVVGFLFAILVSNDFQAWGIREFLDAPTLIWFLLVLAGVITITGEFKTFVAAINALLSRKYVISAHTQERAVRLFRLMGKSVVYAIVVNITIMVALMLLQLDAPSALGPMISVALISVVYGGLFNLMLIYPAIYILELRRNADAVAFISEKQVIDKMLELCYKQGITPEEIVNASEIAFRRDE